jgi:hypothetical protein
MCGPLHRRIFDGLSGSRQVRPPAAMTSPEPEGLAGAFFWLAGSKSPPPAPAAYRAIVRVGHIPRSTRQPPLSSRSKSASASLAASLEMLGETEACAQTHPDLPDPPDGAQVRCLVLAIIGQAAAVATHENPARGIQESNPAAAVPAIGVSLTPKPRSASAKCARRPIDQNALRYRRSVLSWPTP